MGNKKKKKNLYSTTAPPRPHTTRLSSPSRPIRSIKSYTVCGICNVATSLVSCCRKLHTYTKENSSIYFFIAYSGRMFDNLQTVDDTFDLDSLPDHHHHYRHQVCLMQFFSLQHLLTGLEQMAQVLMASFTVTETVVCSFFVFLINSTQRAAGEETGFCFIIIFFTLKHI